MVRVVAIWQKLTRKPDDSETCRNGETWTLRTSIRSDPWSLRSSSSRSETNIAGEGCTRRRLVGPDVVVDASRLSRRRQEPMIRSWCDRAPDRRPASQSRERGAPAGPTVGPRRLGARTRPADPVALLEAQNATREADLVPVRHGRMLVSPFTFYRGAAKVMAADLKDTPTAGLDRSALRRRPPLELRCVRLARTRPWCST